MFANIRPPLRRAVVAIPAHNEAGQIENCLAALAVQRDDTGAPIARDSFDVLIFANNCSDRTAERARAFAALVPHRVIVVEETMAPDRSNAGWARKRAMDLAAGLLTDSIGIDGVILTTDADSCVSPTWFSANMKELAAGADCVAGYIDANPREIVGLGPAFLARGRLEDTYLALAAEIHARCDPRPHNPWPNHRVSSGASLAIALSAYAAIGGLPPRPLGEDAALTATLDRAGFKVRHAMEVYVTTSCRFDGRAQGGAADTMRHRHEVPDAPCDDEIEPALALTRRAVCKGMVRQAWATRENLARLLSRLQVRTTAAVDAIDTADTFEDAWAVVCRESRLLQRTPPLRPSDLPRQIAIARLMVTALRSQATARRNARGDRHRHERSTVQAYG